MAERVSEWQDTDPDVHQALDNARPAHCAFALRRQGVHPRIVSAILREHIEIK